ncbi:hypothetical protein [Roseovarius indicus]|uniref:Uncharacterized protein n=2 Tax=Roseovarius indicus TaxID=540747 RepID=A0A0T5P3K0_9RHOB|nr:hypothetical protein [Roseovarius indicus]KRS15706.1 hypothetical protein XM52_22540 [Roseovarius indicus]OAO07521.1 hypothetical protein A8B76_09855 [Roseovarius indicus]QEW27871.1 hypothetical protein RIdsm_03693 [Roseovarius indicus]SFE78364.1 hypothetical protein SAMN04488031_12144 [Roseovarius indicus]
MTPLTEDLNRLHDRILETEPESRQKFLPKLNELIGRMHEAGQEVPAGIRDLHEDLTADAIEAQFDNLPV